MAQTLREPISLVSRYLTSPSAKYTNRVVPAMGQSTSGPLKYLAPLDMTEVKGMDVEVDSDIEILGPFPESKVNKPRINLKDKERTSEMNPNALFEAKIETLIKSPRDPPFLCHDVPENVLGLIKPPSIAKNRVAQKKLARSFNLAHYSYSKATPTPIAPKNTAPRITTPKNTAPATSTPNLPIYSYEQYTDPKPYLVYTQDEGEANDLVAGLKSGPVALDMEWRVFFTKTSSLVKKTERRTAVVQVADTRGVILIIQVYNMGRFPKVLQALIENPSIPKVGVNILNDGKKLFRDYGILAKNLVELGAVAMVADPTNNKGRKRKIVSLAKLVEQYCSKTLEKGSERTGNWEAKLNQRQLAYAANDVHSSMTVYQRLLDIAQEQAVKIGESTTMFSFNVEMLTTSPSTSRSSSQSTDVETIAAEDDTMTDSGPIPMRPQYLRAYRCWHERDMSMDKMCAELSLKGKGVVEGNLGEGLKPATIISYIIGALQADPTLPFEMWKLRDLVQMDGSSWVRHREWILNAWSEGKGMVADA